MMTITWQQMASALFAAVALHGGIAIWLALPAPEPQPELPKPALRVSLLAVIAQTTSAAVPVTPPPQHKVKPPITPKAKPVSPPKPEPVIQQPVAKPQPVIEPIPQPDPLPIEEPQLATTPEPIPQIAALKPSNTPLDAAATAKYEQLLVAWLEKHKKYPRRAKRLRIEGESRLRILIDRAGQTQKVTLEQRTGNRLLDKAVLEMAKHANPFPPMPEDDQRQTLEFVVPVVFALR